MKTLREIITFIGVFLAIVIIFVSFTALAGPSFRYTDGNSYAVTPEEKFVCVNSGSASDVQVIDVPTGYRARLLYIIGNAEMAQTIILESDGVAGDTVVFGPIYVGTTGGFNTGYVKSGLGETNISEDLLMDNVSAVNTTVCVVYTLLPE